MDRKVIKTGKNKEGDITSLCNNSFLWSPRLKNDAIKDIENKLHTYYVNLPGKERVDIHVVKDEYGNKYLRTDPDKTTKNNLDDLPDC